MNENKTEIALARINEYVIQKRTEDGSMTITLPKQFVIDNRLVRGDKVVVFRNALNDAELVIRVEKFTGTKEP